MTTGCCGRSGEEADIVLAGVSRTSKTPTSIYLANRGYKVANIPLVVESPPPASLFGLRHPLVIGLTTAPKRLVEVRRNRLLSLNRRRDRNLLCRRGAGREGSGLRPAHVCRQWLAGDRCHPPLDRRRPRQR